MQTLEVRLRSEDEIERESAAEELADLLRRLEVEVSGSVSVTKDQARTFTRAATLLSRQPEWSSAHETDARGARGARAWLERACEVTQQMGDHGLEASAALRLGEFLCHRGQLAEAVAVLAPAAAAYDRDFGSRHQIYVVLAQIASVRGSYDEGFEYADDAEEVLKRISPEWAYYDVVQGEILATRSMLHLALGNPDQAVEYVDLLRSLAEERDRPDLAAAAHLQAARIAYALDRYEEVEREVERGLRLRVGAVHALLRVYRALARAHREQADPRALPSVEEELREFLSIRSVAPLDRLWVEVELVDLCLRTGRFDEAGVRLSAMKERFRELLPDTGYGPLERGATLVAIEAALAVERGDEPAELAPVLTRLEAAYERFLEQWEGAPQRSGGVGFLEYERRRRIVSEVLRLSMRVHPGQAGIERALGHLERAHAHGSVARASGYRSRSVAEMRALLTRPGRGFVAYMPGRYRTHLFACDAERLVHAELPSGDRLEPLRREFVAACTSPSERGPAALLEHDDARALAAALLPPDILARVRRWSEAYVVGARLLGYVPFEFLPVDSEELLGDELAIAYLPSIPVGFLLQEREPHGGGGERALANVLIAAPEFAASVQSRWPKVTPLPFGPEERELLAGAYDPAHLAVFEGGAATRERLSAEETAMARSLQILTHGVLDFDRERCAGLVLAPREGDDGLVWCEDVEALRAPPLVVLWACNTGKGPLRHGEDGLSNLGDAFLAAGSRAVVVSSGRLEYEALLALGSVFHERLVVHGDSSAEALRRARGALAVVDAERAHPFYALVHVVGLGHESVFPE